MSGKRWFWILSILLLVGVLCTGDLAASPVKLAVAASGAPDATFPQAQAVPDVEQALPNVPGRYMWNYSVKFVCGFQKSIAVPGQPQTGEPLVKPGNYATEINIHNYMYRETKVLKKLLVLAGQNADGKEFVLREPESIKQPTAFDSIVLNPDGATLDDCNRIWDLAHVNPTPPPLTIGFLVILSPVDLDIDAVYTAAVNARLGAAAEVEQPMGISIDVKRVPGKRVFVPAAYLAQFP